MGDAGDMNSITLTTSGARQAKKPNRLAHQGGGEACPEAVAWPLKNKTR